MQKLYSEIIGMSVFDEYSPSAIALIQDIIIDPETAKVLAFVVKNTRIIVPLDVESVTNGVFIADKDRIFSLDDVLRVKEVKKMQINFIGATVVTKAEKINLGRLVDYEIDTVHFVLTNIHVAKTFFFLRFQERIIPQRSIVRVLKDTVIVKDSREHSAVKEKAAARSGAFAS